MKNLIKYFLVSTLLATTIAVHAQWSGTGPVTTFDQVGIGTSNPQADLDVRGDIHSPLYEVINSSGKRCELGGLTFNGKPFTRLESEGGIVFQVKDIPNNTSQTSMYLIDNGRVGVGAFNPDARLHVRAFNSSTDDIFMASKFVTDYFVVKNDGKVGIGTTNPGQLLDLNGAIEIGNTTSNTTGTIRYNGTNFQGHHNGTWKNLDEAVLWSLNGSSAHYTAGNVGIKTTSPLADLDVHGTGKIRASGTSPVFQLFDDANGLNRITGQFRELANIVYLENLRGDLFLRTGLSGSAANRLIIKGSNGNVGIGTVNPSQKLDIIGGIKIGNTTSNINGSIRYDGTNFQGHTGGSWVNLNGGGSGSSVWSLNGAEAYYNSGNVGIGTTNPAHLLHVDGDVAVAGSVIAPSDLRLKQDIQPVTDALAIVSQLAPKTYTYKAEQVAAHGLSDKQQYGLIAQELVEVLPDLIADKAIVDEDGTSYMGIEYAQLIPILTQAIKELHSELQSTKEKLSVEQSNSKKKFKTLSNRLEALERFVTQR